MASDVDLCNLALAHLGDEAIVSSTPGVRLVVASKNLTLRCGGNSGITLFRSIYRAGVIQGIFA